MNQIQVSQATHTHVMNATDLLPRIFIACKDDLNLADCQFQLPSNPPSHVFYEVCSCVVYVATLTNHEPYQSTPVARTLRIKGQAERGL